MKQKPLSKLKKLLWKHFSILIRQRDGGVCFICGRRASGSGYQASHFIPKSVGGLSLYFEPSNVFGCCYHCNINLGGNLYEFGMKLGPEKVKRLKELQKEKPIWDRDTYERLIAAAKIDLDTYNETYEIITLPKKKN